MFKKIVSQLSLSPSAVSQLTFYAKRLKQERITRSFSAVAAVLIVGLQFATILAPPTASNAASPGDIIYGGVVSKDDLLNKYDASAELKALYARFGITRQDMVNANVTNINSTDHSLNSIGRVQHAADDQPIAIGGTTYWARYLYQFDTGANVQRGSTYQVLAGTRSGDGGYFAVMFRCGNIVFKNLPPIKPTPTPTPTPPPTPKPTPTPVKSMTCDNLTGDVAAGQIPLTVKFTGKGVASGQTITEYQFDFGDGKTAVQPTALVTHVYDKAGTYIATLKVKGSAGTISAPAPACSFTVRPTTPPADFQKAKSALNITQNVDATAQPANPGDTIRYTLTTKNIGGTTEKYSVVEHITDILEYADVTDPTGAVQDQGVLTWPAVSIAPGATLTKTFTVKVKDPIPATPVGVSDKFSYDLRMDNVYGNAVQIKLAPPLPKQVEVASASLPATGPGAGTFVVLLVASLTIYFYLRNRQLAAEVRLLRNDYHGGVS